MCGFLEKGGRWFEVDMRVLRRLGYSLKRGLLRGSH